MALTAGSRFGQYEILGPLGAGGMGEVYRARDAQLRRDVAIKVLPALVANDPERLMRFEREAQALASLNHPHIATVYGLEQGDAPSTGSGQGVRGIVMELVEGPTLSERIEQGRLPWPEALVIARQISDALESAHEKGIVHRDLKPANIKLTPDGAVKVLDFGLAKALDPTTTGGSVAESPTLTARATQMGVILGTAAYMSPEQARGKSVDRRADIWAFGCVLYEMVSGRRAFEGDEITDVLARLIEREPDWSGLPANTAPEMRRLLARCLAKDPRARLRDIGEARVAIDEVLAGKSAEPAAAKSTPVGPRASWMRLLPWTLVGVFAVAAITLFLRQPAARASGPLMRVDIGLPPDVEFYTGPSLSADGQTFVFTGVRQGTRQIYLRTLDGAETRPVPGTENTTSLAISPSGLSVAFVTTDSWLKRLTFSNGIVEPMTAGVDTFSNPAWAGEGSIVFTRGGKLNVRAVAGGSDREIAAPDLAAGELLMAWPTVTSDGALVLFAAGRKSPEGRRSRLEAVAIGGGPRHVLVDGAEQVVFASSSRIVFKQGDALFTVGLDAANVAPRGTPVRLSEEVNAGSIGQVVASVASTGALLTASPSVFNGHLVWVSGSGVERLSSIPARQFQNPRVSPDGRLVAFSSAGLIWTLDPERGTFTRVSKNAELLAGFPVWSHDGTRIYSRSAGGIQVQRADGEGVSAVLPNTGSFDYPNSFTPDGKTLVLLRIMPGTGGDLFTIPADGGEMKPLVVTKAYEGGAQVSPDGKWLLYVSNESGRMDIFLRPFGGEDRRWSVSSGGGLHPLWSRDGKRIFYRSGQQMLAVDVTTTPDVRLGPPQVLFERRYAFGPNLTIPNYSLSADGREFLMVQEEPGGRHLSLVLNWLQHLGQ